MTTSLKEVTITLYPESEDVVICPVHQYLLRDPEARELEVEQVSIEDIRILDDGTAIQLIHYRGVKKHLTCALEQVDEVLDFTVLATVNTLRALIHSIPTPTTTELMWVRSSHKIVSSRAITCNENGSIQLSLVGDFETVSSVSEEIPDTLLLEVNSLKSYRPEPEFIDSMLTPRQQEVLEIALAEGYYETPRQTTQEHLAQQLGLTAGTVGEHLRKVEATVLTAVVQSSTTYRS